MECNSGEDYVRRFLSAYTNPHCDEAYFDNARTECLHPHSHDIPSDLSTQVAWHASYAVPQFVTVSLVLSCAPAPSCISVTEIRERYGSHVFGASLMDLVMGPALKGYQMSLSSSQMISDEDDSEENGSDVSDDETMDMNVVSASLGDAIDWQP